MSKALDGAAVRKLFGSSIFERGRAYASSGRVLAATYDPDGGHVSGLVRGHAARPYEVDVFLSAPRRGRVALDGECTCPVGYNCKHVVAVLFETGLVFDGAGVRLGAAATRRTQPEAPGATPRRHHQPPAWERPLRQVVDGLQSPGAEPEPTIGLQFEVAQRRLPGRSQATRTGIRIRPVLRGLRGNWVRTGISWSSINYSPSMRLVMPEAKRLLGEFLAVGRLAQFGTYQYSYYSHDDQVWLEDVPSRRLWDLLRHAEEVGIPLVLGGRAGGPVRLLPVPAVVGADLVAVGDRIRVAPYVEVDGERRSLGSTLLVGDPPHGLACWHDEPPADLVIGPFPRPLSPGEQALLRSQPVDVPGRDRQRFLTEFFPKLARSVPVVSSDDSVDLPDLPRAQLVLSVRHHGHRCHLGWQRGLDGADWRVDLWDGDEALEPEVAAAVEAATEIARPLPALVEQTWRGERLAPLVELSGMAAVRFVTELLPALGGVPALVVEEVGEAPDYREATEAPVVSLRAAGHDVGGDWFDLAVEVSIDGEDVVFQDLFVAIAEGLSHLVLPSGTYFSLDRPELAELAELIAEARAMQDRTASDPDRIRLSRFQAGLWEDLRRLGVLTTQAEAWESAVRALSEADGLVAGDPPEGLDATLRPYQAEGYAWLAFLHRHRLGGILADDMGLGKTVQALALMVHARQDLGVRDPFLVVAPRSVVENWASECERFAPGLRATTVSETQSRRWLTLSEIADKSDLVVTSYALFRLEYDEYARLPWAGLLLDEAQFVKNPGSITHQRAMALPAPFKLAMTGTPIENNLKELWALLAITAPGLFPRLDRFAEHYAVPIEKRGDSERLAQLRRRIRPLMLRRTKAQVESDLPAKQEQVLELELAPKHKRRYQTHLHRERQKVLGLLGDMNRNRFEILRSLTLLRQAALDVALVDERATGVPSTKLDALMEMLVEIVADGHRVLVFSQFTRFLQAAAGRARAARIDYCYLDGRTRRRENVIQSFRNGDAPVFFISLKAGGFGLNLTEADYCILLDPWWNPATEAQAVDRAHRIGQTRKVMVYRLVAKDTIEEKVMALKAKKAALFANVMDSGTFESAALSAADIRALLD